MIITDASVAAKWVLEYEQDTDKALTILENHKSLLDTILVPELFFYEIANMLATKSRMTDQDIIEALEKIYQADLNIYHPLEAEVKEAAKLAKKYKTSIYDMLYAIVAKAHKAILITADDQFLKQTGFKFVKLL